MALRGELLGESLEGSKLTSWIELILPQTAEVLASYDHPHWGKYAAITRNHYGKGTATYIGCMPEDRVVELVLEGTLKEAGLWGQEQELRFSLITKAGTNEAGKQNRYFFNYSGNAITITYLYQNGLELLTGNKIARNDSMMLEPWGVSIIEEN